MALWSNASLPIVHSSHYKIKGSFIHRTDRNSNIILITIFFADINIEEIKSNTTVLPVEETYTSILLLHVVLCDTSIDHVCT